jgi:hypothetical protein
MTFRRFALSSVLMVSACTPRIAGGSGGSVPDDAGCSIPASVTAAEFPGLFTRAYCCWSAHCVTLPQSVLWACEGQETARTLSAQLAASIGNGQLVVHADAAPQCLQDFLANACSTPDFPVSCAAALAGQQAVGGT